MAQHSDPNTQIERWRRDVRRTLPDADADVVEEIAQFLADRWGRARRAGASAAAADEDVRKDLEEWKGRRAPVRRSKIDVAAAWMGIGGDTRFAVRALAVRPGFAAGASLLSTIAIAAAASAFAIAFGILWRPLPYPDPDRLGVVWQAQQGRHTQLSFPDLKDVSVASVFDGASGIAGGRGSIRVGDRIERVNVIELDPAGFSLLGVTPLMGRMLTVQDTGQPAALVSHRLWRTHLQSDPAIVGRVLWLSGRELTVVGVLHPGVDFELPVRPGDFKRENIDVWTVLDRSYPFITRRDVSGYEGLVRIAPGRTWHDAQIAADTIAARLQREHPSTNSGRTFLVTPLKAEVTAGARRPVILMLVAAGIALLVALANLVILGLVRGAERQAEISVRHALGAGSFRLRRQLFTEHLIIALVGTVCGTLLARGLTHAIVATEAAYLPRADAIRFDAPVLAVAVAVAVLITGVLTIQPLRITAAVLRTGSRTTGGSVRRSRRIMVSAEVTLALALATAGGFFGLSLVRLLAVDPGFQPAAAAAARVSAYPAKYPAKQDVVRFFDDLIDRVKERSDVVSAGAGSSLPLTGQATGTSVVAEGRPAIAAERLTAGWEFVTPGYFEAVGMRVSSGRNFEPSDHARSRHVAIVNQELARTLFPGEHPVGRRIGVGGGDLQGDWHEIVGVVADVRHRALDTSPAPRVYDLFGQHWGRTLYVVARSGTAEGLSLVGTIRSAARGLDPEVPVFEGVTLQTLVARSAAPRRLASVVAFGLAGASVLLALIGIYAVVAAAAAERTHEIGVRAALGASPRDIFSLIAAEGTRTVAAGIAAGLVCSLAVIRLIDAQLFGVETRDAFWLIPLVTLTITGIAALATIPPARRAATVDPLVAMRVE